VGVPRPSAGATLLTVRNFDGRQYYLEWSLPDEPPQRAAAYVARVAGADFAHLTPLQPDGSLPPKHTLLRFDLAPDRRLRVRFLDEKFFEDKDASTSDKLRALVEHNLDNPALYETDTLYAHRAAT